MPICALFAHIFLWQGDISQVSLKAYFFEANCPVGTKNIPTGQIAPKKYALRLTWEMNPCRVSHKFISQNLCNYRFSDSTNVACIQTCKNLGCLSGINLPLSLRNQFPTHPAG